MLTVLDVDVSAPQGMMVTYPDRLSAITRKAFPVTVIKSVETNTKALEGTSSERSGFCC